MTTTAAHPGGPSPIGTLDLVVSCAVMAAFAIAQPLLDLLGRNAEFFIARAAPPLDIFLVAVILAIVFPLLLGLVVAGVAKLHAPTGRVLHFAVLTVLGAVLALQVMDRIGLDVLPGWVLVLLAFIVGANIAYAYRRFDGFRSVVRIGAVAPFVFLGLFLFTSSASQLVFRSDALAQPTGITVENPETVVVIVFDEFPVASLMDGDGALQEEVYPGFARLAEDGTWYRNATSVQQQTEQALPAILTGVDPPEGKLPMAFDYPANLFTLLADSYEIHAVETVTEMCPEYACENRSRPQAPTGGRWRSMADDLRIVAGHLFLPADLASGLPPIDHSWSNFGRTSDDEGEAADFNIIRRFNENVDADRRVPVARFIDSIEPAGEEPDFYYLHALLPHIPWQYLWTGQSVSTPSPNPGSETTGWNDDEWLVDQAYQLHLMQVQYADAIVGEVIDRLEEEGLYHDALIVVLADHGVAVRPNIVHRRIVNEDTIGDIAAIPLFIKLPGQTSGGPDDYRAETIDIVPTIADVLGIELPWDTDGWSLVGENRPERTESQITGVEGVITFGTDGSEARAIASRKVDHFGTDGPFGLAPPGYRDLLGADLDDVSISPISDIEVRIREPGDYEDVDLDAPTSPAIVRGALEGVGEGNIIIAVALNGEIAAVTRSYVDDNGNPAFYALTSPDLYVSGHNDLEVFEVTGTGSEVTLSPMGG